MIPLYGSLDALQKSHPDFFGCRTLGNVGPSENLLPIKGYELCHESVRNQQNLPTLFLTSGIHGIEAIGVDIHMSFLEHLVSQISWNQSIKDLFSRVKIVGIPICNPHGYLNSTRCNFRGVDLMRNAPVESLKKWPLIGGQRLSNVLPYFRGNHGLEPENQLILAELRKVTQSPLCISLDLHSGFGATDYLWTPFAKKKGFPPHWEKYSKLFDLINKTLPHHVYTMEPQSVQYTTSGDFWDFAFEEHIKAPNTDPRLFLPLTLEVGSWIWLRKAPLKALRLRNFFNPAHKHRHDRVLRRHLALMCLLLQSVSNGRNLFFNHSESPPIKDIA